MSHKKKIIYVGLFAFLLTFALGAVYAYEQISDKGDADITVIDMPQTPPVPESSGAQERNAERGTDEKKPENNEEPVFCTMDAKQCPDGSFVSRQAPDCEFAPCPSAK